MGLTADFSSNSYRMQKTNDFVLQVQYSGGNSNTTYYSYDFLARILTVRTSSSDASPVIMPFSELDPDSLETLRERLVKLGGKPPGLPGSSTKAGIKPASSLSV